MSKMTSNKSGIQPHDDRVLVKPDKPKKEGLIEVPVTAEDKYADAAVIGTVIAKGKTAFRETFSRFEVDTEIPLGAKVMFARYVGLRVKGMDGEDYRLMYDRDITAVADPKLELKIGD